MIKSMTGYGRASKNFPFGKLVIEIQCVNRKMLDMLIYLPKELSCFETDVRKSLSLALERGQVIVRVHLQSTAGKDLLLQNYLPQLKILHAGWSQIAKELGFKPDEAIDLPFLVGQMQVISSSIEQEPEHKEALHHTLDAALNGLLQMKVEEGRALVLDMSKRLDLIEEMASEVEKRKEAPLHKYRAKILERLKETDLITPELQERVAKELIFLAERIDVTEELVRLRAHIEQFKRYFTSDKAVGRTLEFLTQEMLREINTLGSKSIDSEISSFVVSIKAELEKIREQVQNIE